MSVFRRFPGSGGTQTERCRAAPSRTRRWPAHRSRNCQVAKASRDAGAATCPSCARRTIGVLASLHGICPGSGVVLGPQVLQRHGHPGNLVVGRGAVTAAIGHDRAADRAATAGDHTPGHRYRRPGLSGGRQGLVAAVAVVMMRCHAITAIPSLRRSGRLPCGHRGQKRGVAPCQVRDAYLVAAGLIELLAELVAVAVVEDSLEHLVAGGLER